MIWDCYPLLRSWRIWRRCQVCLRGPTACAACLFRVHAVLYICGESHLHVLSAADVFETEGGEKFMVYADSIYHTRGHLRAPPKGANVPVAHQHFNKLMSVLRVSVEWSIGKVYNLFRYLHEWDRHKVFQNALAKRFLVCVLLTNCHTCLYGSETSQFFRCVPPELEEYTATMFRK